MTEPSLLRRIAERDASAVDELYDRHAPLLLGLILQIVRDRNDAEDVLQEVFLRVWQRADSYNPALGSPSAWLCRVARNRAIDRVRARRGNSALTAEQAGADEWRDEGVSPEQAAMAWSDGRRLGAALEALAPEERTLIESAYFEGYTQSELAVRFGLPIGTVKARIRRGVLALRERLEGSDRTMSTSTKP